MPISQILFCYRLFLPNCSSSEFAIYRKNKRHCCGYGTVKGQNQRKKQMVPFSVSQQKLDQFAHGLFDINQRHFGLLH